MFTHEMHALDPGHTVGYSHMQAQGSSCAVHPPAMPEVITYRSDTGKGGGRENRRARGNENRYGYQHKNPITPIVWLSGTRIVRRAPRFAGSITKQIRYLLANESGERSDCAEAQILFHDPSEWEIKGNGNKMFGPISDAAKMIRIQPRRS